MTTNLDISNRALALSGTRSQITDFVSTPEGVYCNLFYAMLRDELLRISDYDFSLQNLTPPTTATPPAPWSFGYTYPSDCVRVRQLIPTGIVLNDPQPIEWNLVGTPNIIVTNRQVATLLYTFQASENQWDAIFTDAFVRHLSSALTWALENRMEASEVSIRAALQFASIDNQRDP